MKIPQQCSIKGCGGIVLARGWCGKHYDRWRRHGDPTHVRAAGECSEEGCGRTTVGQGWCSTHYARYVKAPQGRARRLASKEGRICTQCGGPIPMSRNARSLFCSRECKTADFVASGAQRLSVLRSYYKKTYGLTLDEVEMMRLGGCEICGAENGGGRHGQLHIDHDHKTGEIRGMLCSTCNSGLGQFKDDPELLIRAATYLSRS